MQACETCQETFGPLCPECEAQRLAEEREKELPQPGQSDSGTIAA